MKAHVMGIPGAKLYTFGIGYERLLKEHLVIQFQLNRYGHDITDGDGDAELTTILVPEIKQFFGKKKATLNKAAFFTFALGMGIRNNYSGGEVTYLSDDIFLKKNSKVIQPSATIGKNIDLGNPWFLELFVGAKQNFAFESTTFRNSSRERFKVSSFSSNVGARVGFNVGYRF